MDEPRDRASNPARTTIHTRVPDRSPSIPTDSNSRSAVTSLTPSHHDNGLLSPGSGTYVVSPAQSSPGFQRPDSEGLQLSSEAEWHHRNRDRDSEGLQAISGPHYASGVSYGGFSDGSATLCPVEPQNRADDEEKEVSTVLGGWDGEGVREGVEGKEVYLGKADTYPVGGMGGASAGFSQSGGKEAVQNDSSSDHIEPGGEAITRTGAARTQKKRLWILGGVLVAVVVILIAVLGGVLGSRAHNKSLPSPGNPSPAAAAQNTSSASSGRIQGHGTWNGTGLATFRDEDETPLFLAFQDSTGAVYNAPFSVDNSTHKLSLQRLTPINITAANGTGLAGAHWSIPGSPDQFSLQLLYVDTSGHLADAWEENAPSGVWINGNLSDLQIVAPKDNRVTMNTVWDSYGGIQADTPALKLFVGGIDGIVHQYSMDYTNKTWYPWATHNFTDAWAYGGASSYARQISHGDGKGNVRYKTTLFLSNKAGSVQSYVQKDGADGEDQANWPNGAAWSLPIASDQKILPNSSLELVRDYSVASDSPDSNVVQDYLLLPSSDGNLVSQLVNITADEQDGSFGDTHQPADAQLKVMQGSDFESVSLPDSSYTVLFYQDEGTSIAYNVIEASGHDIKASGHVSLDDNFQWIVT